MSTHIVSDEGFGRNEYIETTRPLVVVTAPDRAAEKWRHVFHSFIMKTSVELRPATPNTKHFLSGIFRSSTL